MLDIPENGFTRSVNEHNIKIGACADWIESTILFKDATLTDTDIIDALCENHIYDSQDFANAYLGTVHGEIRRRNNWLASEAIIERVASRLRRLKSWEDAPAHAFCLLLSLADLYPTWAKKHMSSYSFQGELFERVTQASLKHLFPGWEVCRVGWSTEKPERIKQVAETVAKCLRDDVGDVDTWASKAAQDGGLDIVLYRPFSDERCSAPAYLLQCASGRCEDKFHTPDLNIWRKIVDFSSEPRKAFATPYTFDDHLFRRNSNLVHGPLFDRYRLLASGKEDMWLPDILKKQLKKWIKSKIASLPRLAA